MKKTFIILCYLISILLFNSSFTYASERTDQAICSFENIKIFLDGNEVIPKDVNGNIVEPFTIDGTTYLPVRALSTALNFNVDWNGENNTITLKKIENTYSEINTNNYNYEIHTKQVTRIFKNITIVLNDTIITPTDVNGNMVEPFIIDGTTYLPLRAICNSLNINVDWNDEKKYILLTSEKNIPLESIQLFALYQDKEFTNYTLCVGEQLQLHCKMYPENSKTNLTWRSTLSSIVSVDNNGIVTANGVGSHEIQVIDEFTKKYSNFRITVISNPSEFSNTITAYKLNSSEPLNSITLHPNKFIQIVLNQDTANNRPYIWQTDNSDIINISTDSYKPSFGRITGKKTGTTKVKIYDPDGAYKELTVNVINYDEYIKKETEETKETTVNTQVNLQEIENTKNYMKSNFQDSVVKVLASNSNTESQGTGFFFDKNNLILTNYHVVESCDYFEIEYKNSKIYRAYLVKYDKYNDLAVLYVPDLYNYKYLSFENGTLKLDEVVYAVGYPRGTFNVTAGVIKNLNYYVDNNYYIASSAFIFNGNSGRTFVKPIW